MKIVLGVLILTLIVVPLLATACEEEVIPPSEEEEQPPAEEEEEEEEQQGNWWDKFGEPQYGGTINVTISSFSTNFDNYVFPGAECNLQYEALFEPDWTVDREVWSYTGSYIPDQYWTGNLAEYWEITDSQTVTVHLREGVHWQNKPPVNGREFTAYDVQAHYDRAMGRGSYTEGSPMYAGTFATWESVTATDNYTVVFEFKTSVGQSFQALVDRASYNTIEPPEVVEEQGGSITDWTGVVGTGPWILTDFVEGSSLTFSANPDYWGTDPLHPENQIPYADTLVLLILPEESTRITALRTGQVDILGVSTTQITWQQAQALTNTNPDLVMKEVPDGSDGVTMKVTEPPFTDIRVRQALNMALNREEINIGYYGGTGTGIPCGLMTTEYAGYAFTYEDWPQELKDQYAYNPEGARQLLAEAAADGVFTPNSLGGFDTNVIASSTASDIQLLESMQSYFLDIGVNMEIRPYDNATFEAMRRDSQHDQMCASHGASYGPPSREIDTFYSAGSDQGAHMVSDPNYDALREQFFAATDLDEAARIFSELDKYVIEMHWLVTACEHYAFRVWQPYLKGYSGEALQWGAGITLARLWID